MGSSKKYQIIAAVILVWWACVIRNMVPDHVSMFSKDAAFSILFWFRLGMNMVSGGHTFREPFFGILPSDNWYKFDDGEDWDPFLIVDWNNVTEDHIIRSFGKWEKGLIFKNFTQGRLDHMRTADYVFNTLDNDVYEFYQKTTYGGKVDLPLHEGMKKMMDGERILLRGSVTFTKDSQPFWKDIMEVVDDFYNIYPVAKKYVKMIGSTTTNSFVHWSNWYHTTLHKGIAQALFLQIANTKVWHFVHNQYTPVMDCYNSSPGMTTSGHCCWDSERMAEHRKKLNVVTMMSEPGDLIYFPVYWWHEVELLNPDEFGLMLGFRNVNFLDAITAFWPLMNRERNLENLHFLLGFGRLMTVNLPKLLWRKFWDPSTPINGETLRKVDLLNIEMQSLLDPQCREACNFDFADKSADRFDKK